MTGGNILEAFESIMFWYFPLGIVLVDRCLMGGLTSLSNQWWNTKSLLLMRAGVILFAGTMRSVIFFFWRSHFVAKAVAISILMWSRVFFLVPFSLTWYFFGIFCSHGRFGVIFMVSL